MKTFLLVITVFLLVIASGLQGVSGQESTACPVIVQQALATTAEACTATGRNQACYGNLDLTADPQPGVTDLKFEQTGDIADVTKISALRLSNLNAQTGTWGVALLKLRANLPETLPGQNVIVLLFGNVELLQDPHAENGQFMQAFYFRAGVGDAPCAEAPDSGILIQTPEGAGLINLRVNEVDIRLGSTVYLQSGTTLTINVIEGAAQITSQGTTQVVPAGSKVNVPLDENLAASGPPSNPEPYILDNVQQLPINVLERPIEIMAPPTTEDLHTMISVYQANLAAAQAVAGLWTVIDTDGSTMTLQVDPLPQGGIFVRLYDDGASVCDPDLSVPAEAIGSGQLNLAGELIVDTQLWCLRAERELLASFNTSYSVNENGRLVDSSAGIPWSRLAVTVPTNNTQGGDNSQENEANPNNGAESLGEIPYLEIFDCSNWRKMISAGQTVAFQIGVGRWETTAETQAALAGHSATISIDGMPLSVYYEGYTYHGPGGYGDRARANWTVTSGTHTVIGGWSNQEATDSCTFVVP